MSHSVWLIRYEPYLPPQPHFYLIFFNRINTALVQNKSLKTFGIFSSGFCFLKSRSVTPPNGLGFCFRITRPVTLPDFCLWSTLCLIISPWWRHKHGNLVCTYTPTGYLSVTYDVTDQFSLVTSLVTKQNFWILFPKITVGDIPVMLPIKVKESNVNILHLSRAINDSHNLWPINYCFWLNWS